MLETFFFTVPFKGGRVAKVDSVVAGEQEMLPLNERDVALLRLRRAVVELRAARAALKAADEAWFAASRAALKAADEALAGGFEGRG